MNFEYRHLLPSDFSPKSKVWIYQSSRLFTISEALEIEELLNAFTAEWVSHGDKVKAFGQLFFGQFIILMADETQTTVGGCSTDASMRFIKELEKKYGVDLFNRTNLAFVVKDRVQVLPMNQLPYAFENGFINEESLYFNNMIVTKADLDNNWIIPVKQSWIASKVKLNTVSGS